LAGLYGLIALWFLFSNLLGIGLGDFQDLPRPLNYIRAIFDAILWPLSLLYRAFVRRPRVMREESYERRPEFIIGSCSYWKEPGERPEAVSRIFNKHPLLAYFSVNFYEDGSRETVLSLRHHSTVLKLDELSPYSPVRRTLEEFMKTAEADAEEPWEEDSHDDTAVT
jgi:hypothetical protein